MVLIATTTRAGIIRAVESLLGPLLPLFERERAAGRAVALGVLVDTAGSTYRKPGALMPRDGGDCEKVLAQLAKAGVDVDALAAQLQQDGAKAFVKSWNELMAGLESKSAKLSKAGWSGGG